MVSIDMSNLDNRKRVIAAAGYFAIRLELGTGLKSRQPVLRALQAQGFTSKTKKSMACELYQWFLQFESTVTNRSCAGCASDHYGK